MDDGFLHGRGRGRRVAQQLSITIPILLSSATTNRRQTPSSFWLRPKQRKAATMQLKTVLLSALLSGLPATLANPISEVRAPGELHKDTKHGNNKGGNGNGHGNGHGNGNGNGNGDVWVDQGPWWSVRGFSRHWNDTTKSVELSFAIWDSRDNTEVDCNVNAPIPDGQNYKFAEFHSQPCSKNDPPGAQKWLISMGYVEYFDAGIMNICE